ncbi:flippase-like domain-containing protein [Porphyromonas gingivalis]|uniref:lysylphosphatidylglycerol synthase transmembrane domain-containing protein n=1 Tax=Porphyromonas gingivalis TaxID=837 RepID=UPI002658D120|nr:lysylphosphatidylglycerol synthase transmembrane domain-containing protein [Porphyromonas gingivalis]MDP0530717.1 flippase-like domain-containing protein [Porphyromonas gingivalis]MDP0623979.1 flippase-like domain-containing protein [Porphyromonas gingivalis]WKD52904.1 flippase-like domain-containing protein [Porphyromonas gingivalis]WKD54953.1 flippase-like domain-containing protein [Porphyromonas gingivalis]
MTNNIGQEIMPADKSDRWKSVAKVIIPLAIGGLLLWLVYRKMDFSAIGKIVRDGVNYCIIAFSLLFGLAANCIRGLRWQLLIEPLASPHPRKINAILTTLGNYTVNMALPRAGEFWRCAEESRYEKIPFPQLLGTLFMDRIMDLVMVGLITLSIMMGFQGFFSAFFARNPQLTQGFFTIFSSIWLYVVVVGIGLLFFLLYKYLSHVGPIRKVAALIGRILEGLRSIWHMEHKWLFILYSILLWVGYFFYFYTTFFAFDFTRSLGMGVGLISFAMSSIAVAVPVQGGVGPWHFMVIATLVAFGVTKEDAGAFALVVHTTQTVWTTAVGFVAIGLLPFVNKKYDRIKQSNN